MISGTPLWQAKRIIFDHSASYLEIKNGEEVIDSMDKIEDRKGDRDRDGVLTVTNLRLIWLGKRRFSISIGFSCIVSLSCKTSTSKLHGECTTLAIIGKHSQTRYEFFFSTKVDLNRVFMTAIRVHEAFLETAIYRDVKLRGIFIKEKQLILVPEEQVIKKIPGVWNLANSQGNLGTFYLTNVRLVWHGNLVENFNISIPYIQMKCVKMRESKFGSVLIVETFADGSLKGLILGFRIDPAELLTSTAREIRKVQELFSKSPIYGVRYYVDQAAKQNTLKNQLATVFSDDPISEDEGPSFHGASYIKRDDLPAHSESSDHGLINDLKTLNSKIQFSTELGLAIGKLPEQVSIEALWRGS